MATVTIDGLECEMTYSIIAEGTLKGILVGPRSSHGTISTGPCSVVSTTSTTAALFSKYVCSVHTMSVCILCSFLHKISAQIHSQHM